MTRTYRTTKIQWTEHTWNPMHGCTPVSEGCANCYAKRIRAQRFGDPAFKPTMRMDKVTEPLHWRKPRMVFVCSMGDLFHPDVPDEFIDKIFAVMANAERHTFLVLTKRADRMQKYFNFSGKINSFSVNGKFETRADRINISGPVNISKNRTAICGHVTYRWPLPNVWLGVTAENQQRADERIPFLLQTQTAKRFVSLEPLLGQVDITKFARPRWGQLNPCLCGGEARPLLSPIDWVIVGGETGPGARECREEWVKSIWDQCQAASVPFFFKSGGRVWMRRLDGGLVQLWDWEQRREWPGENANA